MESVHLCDTGIFKLKFILTSTSLYNILKTNLSLLFKLLTDLILRNIDKFSNWDVSIRNSIRNIVTYKQFHQKLNFKKFLQLDLYCCLLKSIFILAQCFETFDITI